MVEWWSSCSLHSPSSLIRALALSIDLSHGCLGVVCCRDDVEQGIPSRGEGWVSSCIGLYKTVAVPMGDGASTGQCVADA